jgi:hypothetical protein
MKVEGDQGDVPEQRFVAPEARTVARRMISFADFVARRPTWLVVATLMAVSLLKSGFVVWNWFELSPQLLTNWDSPNNSFQSNVLFNAFGTAWKGVGLDTTSMFWLLTQVMISIAVIVLLSVLVLRRTRVDSRYLALAVVLSSGIAAVAWREIGRYDAFFIAGVAIAVLAERRWVSWLGAFIAALTSPEQLLISGALLLLLAFAPTFRGWRAIAIRLITVSAIVIVVVQVWFTLGGHPAKTRIGILVPFISGHPIEGATAYDTGQGFIAFTLEKAMVAMSAGPALVWSYLGATALLLVIALVSQRSWQIAAYLLLVVIVLPLVITTLVGEDRTRDLALVCAPMIIVIIVYGSRMAGELSKSLPGGADVWLAWGAVVVTLIPLTYFYLQAEESFHWAKELLIAVNNGVMLPQNGSAR